MKRNPFLTVSYLNELTSKERKEYWLLYKYRKLGGKKFQTRLEILYQKGRKLSLKIP
jgi:hypothetical protein